MRYALALLIATAALPAAAQQPQPPAQEITVKLPLATWNVVMQALLELPMRVAQPVVTEIQKQAQEQLAAPAAPEKPKK